MADRPASGADRLGRALSLAVAWHGDQRRKTGGAPYISHLLQVAGLVLEHGGTVDQAVAALLHDAVEDTAATLDDVEAEFGPGVAAVVAVCTDTLEGDTPEAKSPWAERKAGFVERLRTAPDDAVLVAVCDKRHNLAGLVAEAAAAGIAAISPPRFNAEPAQQLWYYDSVLDAVAGRIPARLEAETRDLVAALQALIAATPPAGGGGR
jgi:(p)ppGpp synthase/HD superfamily hydrolase